MDYRIAIKLLTLALMLNIIFAPGTAWTHCDSLDGPVVRDARDALEKEDPTPVLKWVRAIDESEIRKVFTQTLQLRKLTPQAKEVADIHFFETLVRIHRAGEGEGFTGLKPADDVDPGILAADTALEHGTAKELSREISSALQRELQKRFELTSSLKKSASANVQAGREFVKAYVDYIHFVEGVHNLVAHGSDSHHQQNRAHQAEEK